MIKTITKFFAFATILKNLLETKKGDIFGNTQIHPSKFPGRTIFVREKENFIRESYVDGTTTIVFLHSFYFFLQITLDSTTKQFQLPLLQHLILLLLNLAYFLYLFYINILLILHFVLLKF